MNSIEKAIDQINNCSRIVACKTFDEVESLFHDLERKGYRWIDGTTLEKVLDDLVDIDRTIFVAVYDDEKVIEDFLELSVMLMKDEDKSKFLDKVTTYK